MFKKYNYMQDLRKKEKLFLDIVDEFFKFNLNIIYINNNLKN